MKRLCIMTVVAAVAVSARADTWKRVTVVDGEPRVYNMEIAGKHTLGVDEYPVDYPFPDTPSRYWKRQGTDWVEMSPEEKDAVGAAIKEDSIAEDPKLGALIEALAKELKMTKEELTGKIKARMSVDKLEKQKKERR